MIARVIVDIDSGMVDKIFDYSCCEDIVEGTRVLVPFGKLKVEGYVESLSDNSNYDQDKIKPIIKPLDEFPVLTKEMLELSKFMVEKYNLKMIDTIKLFLPSGLRQNKVKQINKTFYTLSLDYKTKVDLINKRAKNQLELVEHLEKNTCEDSATLNALFTNSAVKKLLELGILDSKLVQKVRRPKIEQVQDKKVELTQTQQQVVEKILNANNKTMLLHGVTGSGKTEVYMNVISKILEQGKTALMLVPEISLTPQVMQNFCSRFGDNVAILHSGLSSGERFDEWNRILKQEVKIVVGARSAIFAPIKNLGVIIIDEEHDSSYFSESNPRYFTHDIAQFRANFNQCNLVLGSATPSIEDYYKTTTSEYELLEMPLRVNKKEMPKIHIVDMLSEIRNGNSEIFSLALISAIKEKIDKNEQVILFLNRRGYNSYVICKDCGYNAKCEDCDVSLVYHKQDNELKCHYCGKRYKMLTSCPNCGSTYLKYGAIGTQKVVEELKRYFKDTKIFRMDNDTTTTKNSHEQILKDFGQTSPSILVGTQMIAKGHDFPLVTLVGIVDADVSLHFSDYRANERAFSLITQVSGRAGRSEKQGEVVLQTYMPKHFVYRYACDYDYKKFYEREINLRNVTNFPPFAKLTRILITSEDETKCLDMAKTLYEQVSEIKKQNLSDFIYLGVMKSPVKRIEKKFRFQILLRLKPQNYEQIIKNIFDVVKQNQKKQVSVFVEQNPQNLS